MRTNLKVNFAEKDKVKALGARWDPALKVWYIENVPDLTRFAAWIPELAEYQQQGTEKKASGVSKKPATQQVSETSFVTGPSVVLPSCSCEVLPWEHCKHTSQQ